MIATARLARGDVVLVRFPFTDLSGAKVRPAVIVGHPLGVDIILAFITSQTGSYDPRFEHRVEPTDPEFRATGLKTSSVIRLSKLATLHERLILGRLGAIGPRTERAVARGLRHVLGI